MKITDRMRDDHKTLRKITAEIDSFVLAFPKNNDATRLNRLLELLKDHMLIHSWQEGNFLYPFLPPETNEKADVHNESFNLDSLRKQQENMDSLLAHLSEKISTSQEESWINLYKKLRADLMEFLKLEEDVIFPFAEKTLGDKTLEKLCYQMDQRRSEAPPIQRPVKINDHHYRFPSA